MTFRLPTQLILVFALNLLAALQLCGCAVQKEGGRFPFAENVKTQLKEQCTQIKQVGDYTQLKADFDQNLANAESLVKSGNLASARGRLESIYNELNDEASRLMSLARPDWNKADFNATYYWRLTPRDFGFAWNDDDFEIIDIEKKNVRVLGETRTDADDNLQISHTNDIAVIETHLPSTSFELCEFPRSILILVTVTYLNHGFTMDRDFILTVHDDPEVAK